MVEKRNTGKRKINLKDGAEDDSQMDEIRLSTPNDTTEETKGSDDDSKEEQQKKKEAPFKRPMTRETVQAYSRWLHHNTPPNRYFRVKIPWKTIVIAFVFFVVGTALLWWGIHELLLKGNETECWEKIILGAILFIPGSFHTFLAVQALRGAEGYDYEHLTVFENDKFFEED